MRLGTRVLGVLFAANRSARPFTRQEVTLLGSLAAHASVALDNTRLLGETRAALEELGAVNTVVRRHSESLERAAEAHDRMAELILRGGDLDDLAAVVAEVLGGELAILDADGHCLAAVGPDPTNRLTRAGLLDVGDHYMRAVSRHLLCDRPTAAAAACARDDDNLVCEGHAGLPVEFSCGTGLSG